MVTEGRRYVKVTVKPGGEYTLERIGDSGQGCVEKNQAIEIAIGGAVVNSGNKPEFYNPEDDPAIRINI